MKNEKRLIDANALIAEYDRVHIGPPGGARKLMEDAPTVDAVNHGRWEYIPMSEVYWRCSNCKEAFHIPPGCHPATDCKMNYCPDCGAKMDLGE